MSDEAITTPKRLIHNTVFNVATLVTNAVIGFFLIRFFIGHLGTARYGVWVLFGGAVFRYGGMLTMGLNSSVNRYIPLYLAKDNNEGVQRVINTTLFFYSAVSILLVAASLVIHYNVANWFEQISPELVRTAEVLVLVMGFCAALAMPLQLSSAVLSGLQRYGIINLTMLIMLLTRTVLLVVLLWRGYGLLTMGAVLATSEIVVRVLQTIFARKLLSQFVLSPRKIDFRLLREMLAYGINTFLYMGGAFIILQASNIIIGMFIGDREISQFQAAAAGVVLLSQFLYAFTGAIKPAVSDLDARDDEWRVKEIAFLTQKYSLLMIIPAGCFFVAMGRQFLWIWVGGTSEDLNPTTISTMGVILTILAVGHCLRLAQHSNFLVLVGRGQHRIFGILMALTAVLCVSASVVSVKVFNLGLVAIAWSNCLPMVLISGVILPIYFNWTMKISAWESVRRVWWPALLGGLPSVVLISVWKYMSVPDSWAEIFAVVFLTMAVTLVSCWFLSLEAIERRRLVHIVLRK